MGGEMKMTIGTIRQVDPDKLYELFKILEDIGCNLEWSMAAGELSVYAGDIGITFEADRRLIQERIEDEYWAQDAENVAEGYWRE
jgi:hypothetical protein